MFVFFVLRGNYISYFNAVKQKLSNCFIYWLFYILWERILFTACTIYVKSNWLSTFILCVWDNVLLRKRHFCLLLYITQASELSIQLVHMLVAFLTICIPLVVFKGVEAYVWLGSSVFSFGEFYQTLIFGIYFIWSSSFFMIVQIPFKEITCYLWQECIHFYIISCARNSFNKYVLSTCT